MTGLFRLLLYFRYDQVPPSHLYARLPSEVNFYIIERRDAAFFIEAFLNFNGRFAPVPLLYRLNKAGKFIACQIAIIVAKLFDFTTMCLVNINIGPTDFICAICDQMMLTGRLAGIKMSAHNIGRLFHNTLRYITPAYM